MDDRLTTEMDKRRWRKRHSLAIRWIAARVIATFLVPVAIAVIALVGFLYLGFESADISTYWWSITAIAIYIGAFTYGEVYNREARRLFRDTRIALEKHREVLKKNLEPSVEVLRSREDVMRAVGELLVEASAQTQETQTEHGTSRPSQRIVYYFGSANLSPTIAEIKASQRLEGGDMTAVEIYQKGMEEVKRALVQVRQFIRLFDEENFPNRSFEFRRAHLDWLDAQLNLMKTSPNFALYDSRRAPRWNSSRTTLIVPGAYLDVIGDGDSGILLRGKSVSRNLRLDLSKFVNSSTKKSNQPKRYDSENLKELESLSKQLKDIHKTLDDEDG